jgi:hypothetical protein
MFSTFRKVNKNILLNLKRKFSNNVINEKINKYELFVLKHEKKILNIGTYTGGLIGFGLCTYEDYSSNTFYLTKMHEYWVYSLLSFMFGGSVGYFSTMLIMFYPFGIIMSLLPLPIYYVIRKNEKNKYK